MVISSPIVTLGNPVSAVPSLSTDGSPSAPSTIGQDGSDFTTQAALSSLTARPTNNIVNTNSFYDVVFLTVTAGAIKTIQVTFPAGTTIPSGAFFNEAEKCVPGSACTELTGTATKSGQTITYTITNAVNIPAGTKIRLELANINNPLNPSANYKVTVTTRNAANTPIDGPTPSTAYTMKQIGANVIADNSITTGKLSPSYTYTVVLNDDANGNALGWNPDGASLDLSIDDHNVKQFQSNVLVSIMSADETGFRDPCWVSWYRPSDLGFVVTCTPGDPPANGDALIYTVFQRS
jgi:hypothetical protein